MRRIRIRAGRAASGSRITARRPGASPTVRELVLQAALLHDLGKLAISPEILSSAGPLEPHEWDIIRTHPDRGADTGPDGLTI